MTKFIRYDKMSDDQKKIVHSIHPNWATDDFPRFEFPLKKDGSISMAAGKHQPTQEYYHELTLNSRGEDVRTKGDLAGYKTCTFHFAPEK